MPDALKTLEHYHAPVTPDGGGTLLATLIRPSPGPRPYGARFYTDAADPLQVATIRHPSDFEVPAHWHPPVPRHVATTCEVLVVTAGGARLELYDPLTNAVAHRVHLYEGCVVVLYGSGHGLRGLGFEEFECVEVKQGPYPGPARDKVMIDGTVPRAGDPVGGVQPAGPGRDGGV